MAVHSEPRMVREPSLSGNLPWQAIRPPRSPPNSVSGPMHEDQVVEEVGQQEQRHLPFPRSTLIHSTSSLNGPAFLSARRKPRPFTSAGSTCPASLTARPKDVASNFSSGNLTSIHSPFFVFTAARYEKATSGLLR